MTKRYLIIEVPEGEQINMIHWYTRAAIKKLFANAKEVIAVKTFKTSQGHAYTGRAATVYAVKTEEKP